MLFNFRTLMFVMLMLSGEAEEALLSREGADPQLVTRLPVLVRHEEAGGEK